jgi:hypothetical protein
MNLKQVIEDAAKDVRRRAKTTCYECGGRGVCTYRDYNDGGGWDKLYTKEKCHTCGGSGTVGGGQPGLHLYFQSKKERDAFKEKLLRMRSYKWTDEGNTLETATKPRFKET